jgi:hypothetical protein
VSVTPITKQAVDREKGEGIFAHDLTRKAQKHLPEFYEYRFRKAGLPPSFFACGASLHE